MTVKKPEENPAKVRTCTYESCERPLLGAGYCAMHYKRNRKGSDMNAPPRGSLSPDGQFDRNTAEGEGGCIIWTGTVSRQGYGLLSRKAGSNFAHRFAWERANAPIPDGMVVDHVCWNRRCVNVEHLRLATIAQNNAYKNSALSNSKSGVRGVSWHEGAGRWRVTVTLRGKQHHGGFFTDLDEAAEAARALRERLFGEFAGEG